VKVDKNRTKSFKDSNTILIPTVYLKLPVAGKVFVAKQGSALQTIGGGSANTVRASAHYSVSGLDKKFAQQLAKKVQDDIVAKLTAAGFTVKTYDDLKGLPAMQKAAVEKNDANWEMPLEKDLGGNFVCVVATPSDAQNFKSGLSGGIFNQFMRLGKSTLGEGTILIPTYTLAAPQAWGETGSSYSTISAQVNVAPGMNVMSAMASLLTEKGGWGDVRLKGPMINVSEKVGEVSSADTTDHAGNAFSSALSMLGGAGKISTKSGVYELKVDQAAYESGALRGISAFNTEVVNAAAEARK
jgi:hypothetical protein